MFKTIKIWWEPDPIEGQIYKMGRSENPFLVLEPENMVQTLDVRKGWVKFAFITSLDMHFAQKIGEFKQAYSVADNETTIKNSQ